VPPSFLDISEVCAEMLAAATLVLSSSLALQPTGVQRSLLRSAPTPAAARLHGLPPPLLQPTVHRRAPSAPRMVSGEIAAPLIELGVRVDTFLPQARVRVRVRVGLGLVLVLVLGLGLGSHSCRSSRGCSSSP
jgi:hypothetical protein